MITPRDCVLKYGHPQLNTVWLTLWHVPAELQIGVIPKRIYCNKDLVAPLTQAFTYLRDRGCWTQIHTWDGCFNIRVVRGFEEKYNALISAGKVDEAEALMSIHSWALAIDINAFENGLGKEPKLTPEFVACFTDAGFDWGGNFKRKDGMHFQLAAI